MQPDGWGEWGGAGIVMNLNPPVLGADRGHDQGAATPPPDNGADRQGRVSTGGGPPGARVKKATWTRIHAARVWDTSPRGGSRDGA